MRLTSSSAQVMYQHINRYPDHLVSESQSRGCDEMGMKLTADTLDPEATQLLTKLEQRRQLFYPTFSVLRVTAVVAVVHWTMDNDLQEESAADISISSQSASYEGRMAFWSESVNAAEVIKVDGGSICALLTPSHPFQIGRDA